ncbi:MAG: histidine phosphatase family protein [Acidimicrobiia bacterium]|nr:histidine phosphatase family protein [Acidimicrobiia bacterium]
MRTIHLIRHGEVHNPRHVVYADLDGFGLSDLGRRQARATAERLTDADVSAIVHSPLQRAAETAREIAAATAVPLEIDDRLTEWKLGTRWAGVVWEDLPERFPGELESYLATPTDLAWSPEPLSTVAARFTAAVGAALDRHPDGAIVFVSHQDPVQAGRLALLGRGLGGLQQEKPAHAEIITLSAPDPTRAEPWREVARWAPDQGSAFPPVDDSAAEGQER